MKNKILVNRTRKSIQIHDKFELQIDPDLLPYSRKGPLHTPPIDDFEAPDGEYLDVTKKYEGET